MGNSNGLGPPGKHVDFARKVVRSRFMQDIASNVIAGIIVAWIAAVLAIAVIGETRAIETSITTGNVNISVADYLVAFIFGLPITVLFFALVLGGDYLLYIYVLRRYRYGNRVRYALILLANLVALLAVVWFGATWVGGFLVDLFWYGSTKRT